MPLHVVKNLRPSINPEASQMLSRVGRFLGIEHVAAYLVGGFVRDTLLGRKRPTG